MKHALCAIGAALVLAACATPTPTPADAQAHAACRDADPKIGTHMVRRSDCGAPSALTDKEGTQRDMEILRQQQIQRSTAPLGKS
jgi:hypothetical protein